MITGDITFLTLSIGITRLLIGLAAFTLLMVLIYTVILFYHWTRLKLNIENRYTLLEAAAIKAHAEKHHVDLHKTYTWLQLEHDNNFNKRIRELVYKETFKQNQDNTQKKTT